MLPMIMRWTSNVLMGLSGLVGVIAGIDYFLKPSPSKLVAVGIAVGIFLFALLVLRRWAQDSGR